MFDVFGPDTRTSGAAANQCLEMLQTYGLIDEFTYDQAAERFVVRGRQYTHDQAAELFTGAIADMVGRMVTAPDSETMTTSINVEMPVPVVPYVREFHDRHQVYANHWVCPVS